MTAPPRHNRHGADPHRLRPCDRHRAPGLTASKFIDELKGPKKAAAKLVGNDGAYLRFAGELCIEHHQSERLVDIHADDALRELMYFGKTRP